MSIVRLAVRIAAQRALLGRTYAEGRVHDSTVAPLDLMLQEERNPFVILYTDDDTVEVQGRDWMAGDRALDLMIEAAVATAVEVEGGVSMVIPHTDAAMEIVIDIMQRQIVRALTDEGTEWSRLFMRMCPTLTVISARRGVSAENGVRFAARQISLQLNPIAEPPIGAALAPDHPIAEVIAAMKADPDLAQIGSLVEAEVQGTPLPDWDRVKVDLGLALTEARSTGIAPYIEGEDADTLAEVVADDGDDLTDVSVTQESAGEQDPGGGA